MATFHLNQPLILLSLFTTILFSLYPVSLTSTINEQGATNTTHLHFYLHDTLSGSNPSAVRVAGLHPNANSLSFGDVIIFDDPLTKEPDLNSTLIGKAQGFVMGRNSVLEKVREFPIVGGSGVFRGARGWVLDQTYTADPRTGDGIFEFDVYVM